MSDMFVTVSTIALGIVVLGSAVMMLASRNVVHAAYWLLALSLGAAGLFAVLQASYLALVQLLVYAGAVAILNIFTIMITLRRREDAIREREFSVPAAALAVVFFGVVAYAVSQGVPASVPAPQTFPGIAEFGAMLFAVDGWALPFEIASLILVVALVGAVWWTKEGDD